MFVKLRDHVTEDLRDIEVYILADHRERTLRKNIGRLHKYCIRSKCDFRWVGYYGDMSFDPKRYDMFIRNLELDHSKDKISFLIWEIGVSGTRSVRPHEIQVDRAIEARKIIKLIDSMKKSSEKDPKRRFAKLKKIRTADDLKEIADLLPIEDLFDWLI